MIASETFVCQTSFQVNCPNDEKNRSRTVTSKHSIDFNDSWSDDNSTNNVETNKRSIFSEEDLYDYDSSTSSDVNKTDNSTNVDNLKNESIQIGTLNVSSNFENGNNSSNLENKSDDSTSDEICHPNVVAICQTKPEIVTVTEQRQLAGRVWHGASRESVAISPDRSAACNRAPTRGRGGCRAGCRASSPE